jgi:hypothetical protein
MFAWDYYTTRSREREREKEARAKIHKQNPRRGLHLQWKRTVSDKGHITQQLVLLCPIPESFSKKDRLG